jgi:hypothetical protein
LSWEALLEHYSSTSHRTLCEGCDDGDGLIWDSKSEEYQVHVLEENVCKDCHGHFESADNLENVSDGRTPDLIYSDPV